MKYLHLIVLLIYLVLSFSSPVFSANPASFSAGRYAEMINLRLIAVSQALLDFEQELINKLEKKRGFDKDQALARFVSARLQFRKLLLIGIALNKTIPSGDPARARIQSLKSRLTYFLQAHQKNVSRLTELGFPELKMSAGEFAELVKSVENEKIPGKFLIGNLDNAF